VAFWFPLKEITLTHTNTRGGREGRGAEKKSVQKTANPGPAVNQRQARAKGGLELPAAHRIPQSHTHIQGTFGAGREEELEAELGVFQSLLLPLHLQL